MTAARPSPEELLDLEHAARRALAFLGLVEGRGGSQAEIDAARVAAGKAVVASELAKLAVIGAGGLTEPLPPVQVLLTPP